MESQKRIPELDGVRGLAILLVVILHYFAEVINPAPGSLLSYLQRVFGISFSGVDLFFVLSGFLIGGILLDNRESGNYFQTFYARRFFRIFPLYYLVLSLFAIAIACGAQRLESPQYPIFSGALPFWSYLTYTQNFVMASLKTTFGSYGLAATWSLAIEEQFYLVAPLLVRRTSDRAFAAVLIAIIVIAYVSRLLIPADPFIPAYVLPFCRADTLACGMLAALLIRRIKLRSLPLYVGWFVLAAVVGLMIQQRVLRGSPAMLYYGYTAYAFFYMLTVLLAVKGSPLSAFFRLAPLRYLGNLAYCVYLIHVPVNALCHSLIRHQPPALASIPDALVTLLAFAMTVAIAQLSWLYFERPLLRHGHRFRYTANAATVSA
jgi:peptidoglycan/LPS O-acetylase OafA/YrhL